MKQKPKEPRRKWHLRRLERSAYIYFFPLLFALGFMAVATSWEQYYQTEFPFWAYFLLFSLGLLGMVIGAQLRLFLQQRLGKKAEMFINLLLMWILAMAFLAEYQYVFVEQLGAPPLTWEALWNVIHKRFQIS